MSDIIDALSRTLTGPFTLALPLDLQAPHKFIVLSDLHKGAGDRADEFRNCAAAYRTALQYYLEQGFTLILLGDVEELWEQSFRTVESAYRDILLLEGSFPAGRYYRLWGNHDNEWMRERSVTKKLRPYMPTTAVYEAIRFEVNDEGKEIGRLLMLHGHQGTFASDKLHWLGPLGLRFYRWLQRIFGIGGNTPAKDACLRDAHETQMYEWAIQQAKLILLTGHTHRPVWSSRTHLQKLEWELAALKAWPMTAVHPPLIAKKEAEIAERIAKSPPCNETIKITPAYFNSGCCSFDDGDMTGIELEDGVLRLVKWAREGNGRIILEGNTLVDILGRLS
jgi:UDP-2,3-diacylglucosamine pyrophosphatase LpxH